MYKEKIISKHAKKFVSNNENLPLLNGIHYAADGAVYATNRHYALRVRNAHELTSPVTLHAKSGVPIEGQYPDLTKVFDVKFDNELILQNKSQLEQIFLIADCALAVAAKLDKKVPLVDLSGENGVLYLKVAYENRLTFRGYSGTLLKPEPFDCTLNARYFVNALNVFLEVPLPEVKIKFKGKVDPILITDETDVDVLILPYRKP